jgi:hypothetical protein
LHRFSSPVLYIIPITILTTACSTQTELVGPQVPSDLRQPCEVAPRPYDSLRDVALILTDHVEALDCANGRIVAVDTILTEYEATIETGK